MLTDAAVPFLVVTGEQDRDGVQVIAGQAAVPVLGRIRAGVLEDVRTRGHSLPERVGKGGPGRRQGTPSARSPSR